MTYNTPVSYPVVYCWPIVIGLVSAVYCCKHHMAIVVLLFNAHIFRSIDHHCIGEETQ